MYHDVNIFHDLKSEWRDSIIQCTDEGLEPKRLLVKNVKYNVKRRLFMLSADHGFSN